MKPRNNPITRLGLAALLTLVSVTLMVGIAWGRYRTELEPFVYWFHPRNAEQIYLWGGKDGDSYTALPGSWVVDENGTILPFLISNGTQEAYARQNVEFYIQVAATAGIESPEKLALELAVVDGEQEPVFAAEAEVIQKDTVFYEEFGDGWIYRFYNEEGVEQTFSLKGGELSEFAAELHLSGSVDSELFSMLQIQIVGVKTSPST